MTTETSSALKKMSGTVALFFALFLLLMGLQYLTGSAAEAGIRKSAETVLHRWNAKTPALGERILAKHAGWSFTHIYRNTGKGKNAALVFVIPLTGNSGPFTGVFYWSPDNGPVFCGLAGLSAPDTKAADYGITGRVLSHWLRKVEILGQSAGVSK